MLRSESPRCYARSLLEIDSTTHEEVVLQNKSFVEQPELRSDDGADDGDIMVHGRVPAGDPKG